jgi:ankyrin repeat protein
VRLLVAHGADLDARDVVGRTALHKAIFKWGASKSARVLLSSGADPEVRDNKGRTALDRARAKERKAVKKLLIKYKASV